MPRLARSKSKPENLPVQVRRATARETVRRLKPGRLAILLTDPPYETVDRHGGGHLQRWFRGSLSWPEITRLLAAVRRRLQPDGLAMILVNEAGLPNAQAAVRQAGFDRQRLVVWDQRRPGLGTGMRHHVGYVVIGLQPGSRRLGGRDLVSAAAVAPGTKNRYPTEKPVQLGREMAAIAGIRHGDAVLDPFCGSGNLLVGAVERGANVVAGDTSAQAVRMATARLTAAAKGRGPSLDSGQILGTRRASRAKPKSAGRKRTPKMARRKRLPLGKPRRRP